VRELNAYERRVCFAANVWAIQVGVSDRWVTKIAGAPSPRASTTSRWFYPASKPGTDLVSLTVYFEHGRVTRLVEGRCLCGLPAMAAKA
jgi:hypothetical protein